MHFVAWDSHPPQVSADVQRITAASFTVSTTSTQSSLKRRIAQVKTLISTDLPTEIFKLLTSAV
jgi:hypothetical protein